MRILVRSFTQSIPTIWDQDYWLAAALLWVVGSPVRATVGAGASFSEPAALASATVGFLDGPFGRCPLRNRVKTKAITSKPTITVNARSYELTRDTWRVLRKLPHTGNGGAVDKHAGLGAGSSVAKRVAWRDARTDKPIAPPKDCRN
jgi:hypothetical protein